MPQDVIIHVNPGRGEYFFSTDTHQPNVGEGFMPVGIDSSSISDGATKEELVAMHFSPMSLKEIPNPDPKYKLEIRSTTVRTEPDAEEALTNRGYDVAIQQLKSLGIAWDGCRRVPSVVYCDVFVKDPDLAERISLEYGWQVVVPLNDVTRLFAHGLTASDVEAKLELIGIEGAAKAEE